MTIFRMTFAGPIAKVEFRQVAAKTLVEVSLCRKHKGRNGGEDTFSWVKVIIWEPPDWMTPRLVKGAMIGGTGEYQLRSYEGKNGKAYAAEVKCSSFDVEVSGGGDRTQEEQPTPRPRPVPVAPPADDEPPF